MSYPNVVKMFPNNGNEDIKIFNVDENQEIINRQIDHSVIKMKIGFDIFRKYYKEPFGRKVRFDGKNLYVNISPSIINEEDKEILRTYSYVEKKRSFVNQLRFDR